MARVERLSAMQAMYLHSVLRQGGFDAELDQKDDDVYTLSICAEDAEEKLARARAFVRGFRDGMVVCQQLKEEAREL